MELSFDNLKRRLSRATWLPLSLMSAFFIISVVLVMQRQYNNQMASLKFSLSDIVDFQASNFAQEVYMDHGPAIDQRIQRIIKDWEKKHPDTAACIEVAFLKGEGAGSTIRGCSSEPVKTLLPRREFVEEKTVSGIRNEPLAKIRFSLTRNSTLMDFFPPEILVALCLAVFTAFFSYRLLLQRVEKSVLEPLLAKLSDEERNSAIADTALMLAHDIKKPFAVIRLGLESLRTSSNKEAQQLGERIYDHVSNNINTVDSMIKDILDISRNMEPELDVTHMGRLIDQAVKTVGSIFKFARVTVTCRLEHQKAAMADSTQVLRVVTNLLENAFQAMGRVGNIEISTSELPRGESLLVEIKNDGPVISRRDQSRIFKPFVTGKKHGTGLGLAISKKIIESHGGILTCRSSDMEGTVFSFTLPLSDQRIEEPSYEVIEIGLHPKKSEPNQLETVRSRTVLIFDDEDFVHEHWKQYALEHFPFLTFVHFSSWEDFVEQEAFALAEGAIAFVDLNYDDSSHNGLGIAKALRKLGARSICAMTSDERRARECNLFDRVFGKEIPEEFKKLIA